MKIVAVGDNMLDYYKNLEKKYLGGNSINFIMNLKGYTDYQLSYVGPIANDKAGCRLLKLLKDNNIDTEYSIILEGETPLSTVELNNGDRSFLGLKPGVLEGFTVDKHQKDFIKRHNHIHSSILGGTINQLKELKGDGTISFDFSILRNKTIITAAKKHIDYGFFSGRSFGEEERLLMIETCKEGTKHCIFLQGEKGSIGYDGKDFYCQSAEKGKIVDTLGAGDSYIAGYMSEVLKGGTIKDAMATGTKWAINTCSHYGGFLYNQKPVELV
ncbi:hypothetical protein F8154_07005 [Alkaliphilus pronyensis]|uniref:Carbohydrate kinase PfkB domain-containing protein n=1 Tax=Alkaliphilus pronyensis TaxID=1482732 RepID=A0A6I0F955_9FIRM|nr:PfkB family carbohydrate kinase [Alkaliphilus pronyensis]KAB3535333.1 hypothetical protein F8154_07005 [Alkaliphilus pronyensis]